MEHIYWVIADSVGGRCGPAAAPWDLRRWAQARIGGIVSLDDTNVVSEEIKAAGLLHLPVYWPMILLNTPELQREFIRRLPPIFRFLDEQTQHGKKVVLHCYHGMDRTGAVLACYLIYGYRCSAEEAIAAVRRVRPQAMTADGYAEVVHRFAHDFAGGSCIC